MLRDVEAEVALLVAAVGNGSHEALFGHFASLAVRFSSFGKITLTLQR